MFVVTAILSIVLALAFAGAGAAKLSGQQQMRVAAEHFHLSWQTYQGIGALEAAGAAGLIIGLWVALLGAAAAIGLLLLMIGAVAFHVRAKDPVPMLAPAAVLGVIAAVAAVLRIATA